MAFILKNLAAVAGIIVCAAAGARQSTGVDRPPAVIPIESEAAPKLIAYPPLADALARGVVIIQYRTENLRIMPVFGKAAVEVSPHLGHVHVTVDDWPGTWAHTSADPLILVGLKPGPHKILLELADPAHKILARQTVAVIVPPSKAAEPHQH